jgi:23S rRNA (pseudouridine1915-N3)-methyltransferase
MRIHVISVGQRLPAWVDEGVNVYLKRLTGRCRVNLIEIAAGKRSKNADIERIMIGEAQRIRQAIPNKSIMIALERTGVAWSTEKLASKMQGWAQNSPEVALIIGGPEGIAPELLAQCDETWSLSNLTFAHPLARLIVVEQVYRAESIVEGHPYHR